MLQNDPPAGTPVKFLTEVRKTASGKVGKLVRPLRKYLTESADDEFEVDFGGERFVVKRRDIVKAPETAPSR
jgi:hypothetical protein